MSGTSQGKEERHGRKPCLAPRRDPEPATNGLGSAQISGVEFAEDDRGEPPA